MVVALNEVIQEARDEAGEAARREFLAGIAALYIGGMRTTAIALRYHRSCNTVSGWLKQCERLGLVPARGPGRPRLRKAKQKEATTTTGG